MTRRGFLLLLGLVLGACVGAFGYVVYRAMCPFRGWQQPVFVDLAPGTSSRAIAYRLRAAGVLRHEWPFLMLHYVRRGQTLKAGEYYFDRALSPSEVLQKLRRGDVYYHSITIPEGYNIFEVAEALASSGLFSKEDSREQIREALRNTALISDLDPSATNLEGYLFPDTYHFTRRTPAREMAAAMVARFRKVYRELESRHSPTGPVHDIVTLASLIEKETGLPEERPLVAGVFYNRWNAKLPLQCDPTVVYAALLAGRYRGALFQSDLTDNSPYNTYLWRGLPPGPIANPGRASLEAALAPASTPYLYFVSDGESGHRFSTTLGEHTRAVEQYRRKVNRLPNSPVTGQRSHQ